MIPEIGHFALILGFVLSLVLGTLPWIGVKQNNEALIESAKPIAIGSFFILGLSFALLIYAFLQDDFSVKYVASNSNTQLPVLYKVTATWGAHEGSLLLWALILSGWAAVVAQFSQQLPAQFRATMLSVMGLVLMGFILFILLTSNPFERMSEIPIEGRSLNPLLQDIGLAFHPPMLYLGYVGLAVAYAFAVAVLIHGEFKTNWAHWAKQWTIVAWAFLTLGIALGSWWAYYELGWGGWWFWDPVENASLLPWIISTALIHSLSITSKRGSFQSWTLLLAILAFSLSLLGTFLVRSGVLTSVHAFASDPSRGLFILLFLIIAAGAALWLFSLRGEVVTHKRKFSFVSKDSALLFNNVILVVMMATVLLGTLYPLILDALGVAKLSVGPPYFNTVMLPLTIPLAILMGFGFFTQWREDRAGRLIQKLWLPMFASVLIAFLIPLLVLPEFSGLAVIGLFMSAWIGFAALQWLLKQNQAHLVKPSLQSIGAATAHIGFAVMLAGITMTSLYSIEEDVRLVPNERYQINDTYAYEFKGVEQKKIDNYFASIGRIDVYKEGQFYTTLTPEKRVYMSQTMPMTEAGIDAGLNRDLFVALGEPLEKGAWSVRLQYKPMIRWIWLGSILMALGGLITLFNKRKNRSESEVVA